MDSYLGLYILINIFCTSISLLIAIHSRLGMGNSVPQRRFAAFLITTVIFFMSDTLWYAMDCNAITQIWSLSMLLKSIYFLSACIEGYIWLLYMASLMKVSLLDKNKNIILAAVLVVIHAILLAINVKYPILFKIDNNFDYSRELLFPLQYVFIYVYLLIASAIVLYKATRKENHLDRSRYLIISLFPVFPAITGIVQLFSWRVPYNCMGFTLAIIIVYLSELMQQINHEPLTNLANRRQFLRELEQNISENENDKEQLYLLMMDIDSFKQINDNYGHTEGDKAIIKVANALKQALVNLQTKGTLARYGGDEFVVVAILKNEEELELLKENIKSEVAKSAHDVDYTLNISIGVAKYDASYTNSQDFIIAADNDLYKQKEIK